MLLPTKKTANTHTSHTAMSQKPLLLAIAALTAASASATRFAEANTQGVTIYYETVADGLSVYVTSAADTETPYSGAVEIPASVSHDGTDYPVTAIGYRAFSACSDVTSVTLPTSILVIAEEAFSACTGLTSMTVPASVDEIGTNAFSACTSLRDLSFEAGSHELQLTGTPFAYAPIETLYVGRNLSAWSVFDYKSSLTSVTTGGWVTAIGEYAFSGCTGLGTVVIGGAVTSIGASAFTDCTALTQVKICNDNPAHITLADEAFAGIDYDGCTLLVPEGCQDLYSGAQYWSKFHTVSPFTEVEHLVDGVAYLALTPRWCTTITYTRSFAGATGWQPLYLPFAISYDDWKDYGDIAVLESVDATATGVEGIRFSRLEAGSELAANTPCLFCPNATATSQAQVTLTVRYTTLHAAGSKSVSVATSGYECDLYGTYHTLDDLGTLDDAYAVDEEGTEFDHITASESVSPYRIYMLLTQGSGTPVSLDSVKIETSGSTTSVGAIPEAPAADTQAVCYDLAGRRVSNPGAGLYIIGGRKVTRR